MDHDTKDKHLILAREKIAAFRERIKTLDEVNESKQFFKGHFAFRLKHIEKRLELNKEPNYFLLAELLDVTASFMARSSELNNDELSLANALHLNELSEKIFKLLHGKNYDGYLEAEKIGAFVAGLMAFGSSRNRALILTSEWCNLSETRVEDFYRPFIKAFPFPLENENAKEALIGNYTYELSSLFLKHKNKEFPVDETKSSLKTQKAFNDLKAELVAFLKKQNGSKGKISRPFDLLVSWEEYDRIVQELLSS